MDDIRTTTEDGVRIITLSAPQRRNALTPAMALALRQAVDEASSDPGIGALLFRAEGAAFCAGADLAALDRARQDPAEHEAYTTLGGFYNLFATVASAPLPTIAAVQGAVVGAGVNLPAVCDVRVVAEDFRMAGFGVAGLHPGGGHLSALLDRIGPTATAAIALCGEWIDAATALRLGFAWKVVPAPALHEAAMGLARRAAADPELSRAVTATLRTAASARGLDPRGAVQIERAAQMWSLRRWSGPPGSA